MILEWECYLLLAKVEKTEENKQYNLLLLLVKNTKAISEACI